MADTISRKPDRLPGGPYGQILVWTPPAMPWVGEEYEEDGTILRVVYGHAALCWDLLVNRKLQGANPNRWIGLNDAAWIIAQKLSVPMGEGREVLQREALPPAVPWVGLDRSVEGDDATWLLPWEIDRATVEGADVDFNFEDLRSPACGRHFRRIHIELNHLEAWLEKKLKAREVQPVLSVSANKDMAPKNKGGAPRKFDKEAFMQQAARELVLLEGNGRKKRQALTAIMAEWCLATWGEEPDTTTLRRWMAEIFNPTEG
jgi:hypothetical protein